MAKDNEATLTFRINAEPAIIRGLSSSEAVMSAGIAFAFWLPLSLLIGFVIGHMMVAVIFIVAGTMGTVFFLSTWLQKMKRDRPDFYFQQMIKIWRTRFLGAFFKSCYITHDGYWMIGRSMEEGRQTVIALGKRLAIFSAKARKN